MARSLRIEYPGPIDDMTTKATLAAVLLHAPAVTGLDQDPLEVKLPAHRAGLAGHLPVIESGDWVNVDADKDIIEVTKKE